MSMHSKTEDGTPEYESQQEDSRGRKVNYKQQTAVQQYSKIISPWTSSVSWSSIKRIRSEALALGVSTSK